MMRLLILFASLLIFPASVLGGEVILVENGTKWKFNQEKANDIYHKITRHFKNLGLEIGPEPRVLVHLIQEKNDSEIHMQCLQGGCGHLLRVRTINKKGETKNVAFVGISSKGIELWMNKPEGLLMAYALIISLDYENRSRS